MFWCMECIDMKVCNSVCGVYLSYYGHNKEGMVEEVIELRCVEKGLSKWSGLFAGKREWLWVEITEKETLCAKVLFHGPVEVGRTC